MSGVIDYKWRETQPSKCPPNDAKPFAGYLYRAVYRSTPNEDDFRLWAEESKNHPSTPVCCREYAISMFDDPAALKRVSGLFGFQRRKFIAKVQIKHEDGVSKKKRGHHSFWPDRRADLPAAVSSVTCVVDRK